MVASVRGSTLASAATKVHAARRPDRNRQLEHQQQTEKQGRTAFFHAAFLPSDHLNKIFYHSPAGLVKPYPA